MPIHQDRMKALLDAATQREEDFIYLHQAIQSILERGLAPEDAIREIAVELTLRRGLMKSDAIIAQERMHYNLTHKDNQRKRANMIRVRNQQRADGLLNTKPRISRHSYHNPLYEQIAREGNADIPEEIKLRDTTPALDTTVPVPLHPDLIRHQEETKERTKSKINNIELPPEEDEENAE